MASLFKSRNIVLQNIGDLCLFISQMNKVFTIHNVLISLDGEYEQFCVIIIGQKLVMEAKVSSKNS